uniref:Uncharacterized protein n=1 Tax=Arundo donax TaxID=35708 RepID=A0A0A9TMG2_ARUDO
MICGCCAPSTEVIVKGYVAK